MIPVFAPKFGLAGVIAGLFSAGEQGVWYDPSDMSTMFQDAAGTTPVTGMEQPVGRILDKSGRGNHATQTTTTSRPVLSARVNLLTKTEQFDDAAWVKNNATVTANAAVAPDGTTTADRIVQSTGTDGVIQQTNISYVSGVTYKASIRAKKDQYDYVLIALSSAAFPASNRIGLFNLATGQVASSSQSGINATIVALGNGWYECSITQTANATISTNLAIGSRPSDSLTGTGDGTSGIYIWGASLVPADQASLPYQRVNTATDYDADPSKFKPYLRFDGVDDWLVTPTITPGIDKAQVFAGVRKLSDPSSGQIAVELSDSASANAGAFFVAPTVASTFQYGFRSGGTIRPTVLSANLLAPTTNVLTGLGNISGDSAILRVNGTQVYSDTSDQGTGNFGNYPLYIGRRGGTALPFNGNLYGLIVRFGNTLPTQAISGTEAWLNGKTRAYA